MNKVIYKGYKYKSIEWLFDNNNFTIDKIYDLLGTGYFGVLGGEPNTYYKLINDEGQEVKISPSLFITLADW